MINRNGTHIWYELLTHDRAAAAAFYAAVIGWELQILGDPENGYFRLEHNKTGVGGIASQVTPGPPPLWLGYVGVTDVDATVERIKAGGGGVHVAPTDIPGIGRFALVNDPQGAVFYVMRGASDAPSEAFAPGREGHGEWHELHTNDAAAALQFYAGVFGWTRGEGFDMGQMGVYQLFGAPTAPGEAAAAPAGPRDAIGGMMNSPNFPQPQWLYYFNVSDIDAAIARLVANGGSVMTGPLQTPGGNWIVQARDPQGALFALTCTKP